MTCRRKLLITIILFLPIAYALTGGILVMVGSWSAASPPITKDWVEGPTIARVGEDWYIYYDEYRDRTYGAVRTRDFKTFDEVKENFDFPKGARHGTVFSVTPETLARLKSAGPIDIPNTPPANESR